MFDFIFDNKKKRLK